MKAAAGSPSLPSGRSSRGLSKKARDRLGLARATLTLGHETFVGVTATAGFFSRQRVNFSGSESGRERVSVAADLAFNAQLYGLPAGGFGYILGTDHRLDGSFVNVSWGPIGGLHHPDYGDCVGLFLPGLGGLLFGREVIAFGCAANVGLPFVREGGYVFLRHPALRVITSPAVLAATWILRRPLIDRRVVRPMQGNVRTLKHQLGPMQRAEERLFRRGAEALKSAVESLRGGPSA